MKDKNRQSLERNILACLILYPAKMDHLRVKSTDFKYERGLFLFMQTFYERYNTFDLTLMSNVCSQKVKMIERCTDIISRDFSVALFEQYQDALLEVIATSDKLKRQRLAIYNLTNRFMCGTISVEELKKGVEEL